MGYSMKMGSKQKHDPNNFSQKDQGTMATIPGAGEKRVVGGSGFIGYLGSGGLKAAGKILKAFTNTPKQLLQAARYKPGKVTNKFNKSVKDKPAYGIDQYKYAKSAKSKKALATAKKGIRKK